MASTEFFKDGKYHMEGKAFSSEALIERYVELCAKYPICSIEDGLAENDFEGWIKLTEKLGNKIQLVGDDLFVTNEDILREGIIKKNGKCCTYQTKSNRNYYPNYENCAFSAKK
ncbi:hypothetical protein OLV04_01510 [Campylobacter jejuni]|nr:hypothetical protein [Campylobacter jejuni]